MQCVPSLHEPWSNFRISITDNQKISLPVLTKSGQKIQIDFSGKLHNRYVTGEPYVFIGIDR